MNNISEKRCSAFSGSGSAACTGECHAHAEVPLRAFWGDDARGMGFCIGEHCSIELD